MLRVALIDQDTFKSVGLVIDEPNIEPKVIADLEKLIAFNQRRRVDVGEPVKNLVCPSVAFGDYAVVEEEIANRDEGCYDDEGHHHPLDTDPTGSQSHQLHFPSHAVEDDAGAQNHTDRDCERRCLRHQVDDHQKQILCRRPLSDDGFDCPIEVMTGQHHDEKQDAHRKGSNHFPQKVFVHSRCEGNQPVKLPPKLICW